jgi:CheY-like chemotaxis protein
MAREFNPGAISLDIHLPDIDGWRVLERLKREPATRHIPVCVVSTEDARDRALNSGSLAFLAKPIRSKDVLDGLLDYVVQYMNRGPKRVVVADPDLSGRGELAGRLEGPEVEVVPATEFASAVKALTASEADCVILNSSQMEAFAESLLEANPTMDGIQTRLPVIVYKNGSNAAPTDEGVLRRLSDLCLVRGADSVDAIVDLATFYLHRPVAKLPDAQRERLLRDASGEQSLAGRKILIVDDDMRNIFALSSVLEEHGADILSADNGRDAIRILREDPEVEIVLMDIMMPEMDGMETMREIRKIPQLKNLPIVAVTAKAMKGDREKCIEAGAWDYMSKPVDMDQLLGVLRSWLNR